MELTAGIKLGIFTIERQIGAGGMSEVYLVRDDLDRVFALKTMSRRLSFETSFRQRFQQEAKIMASLNHPNIVQMHSYFEAEERFCLVMEYVEGGSLKDLTRRIGPIREERALNILRQIAAALSHAHGKGIIHRDVKPSNILLDENDNVKVMDFGIARMTEGPGLTSTGTQMGTLVYMSPEQVKDSKNVDERTDIYSLGVSFYEMLTGKPPYDDQNSSDFVILESIVYKDLPNPREVYPYIGEESLRLLTGLTHKNREDRLPLSELLASKIPQMPVVNEVPQTSSEQLAGEIPQMPVVNEVPQDLILPEMIFVEGGSFQMGSNDGDSDEKPIHEIAISSFWISKYQITQKEWEEIMENNLSKWEGDNFPVENVNWYEAAGYCNRRSKLEGLTPCYSGSRDNIICNWNADGYRLPTEAEWEYAARGGFQSKGYKYSGSNDIDAVAWHNKNSGRQTHEVGSKSPNELGINDMSGNVWEWCWDKYKSKYYKQSPSSDPIGPARGPRFVMRGGSWYNKNVNNFRVSYRSHENPHKRYINIGFRVVRTHFE